MKKTPFLESFSFGASANVLRQAYIVAINITITKVIKAATSRMNRILETIELDKDSPQVEIYA